MPASSAARSLWIWSGSAAATITVAALLCALVIYLRSARRLRRLESELRRRCDSEIELQNAHGHRERYSQRRIIELESRTEELLRQRLALQSANQRLRRLAAMDALTGIANRRHFDRSLDLEVRRARRDCRPLSLIFLDLDEFKRFNDTYGHPRGDEVLRHVARTLNETFQRGGDFVARYGGEEFAVVLPDVDARRAALYAERLRRRIWRLSIPYEAANSSAGRVTISGGVATLDAGICGTADQLLGAADQALYRAKCLGRNQIASATLEPPAEQKALAS